MSRMPRTVGSNICANTMEVMAAISASAAATARIAIRCGFDGLSGDEAPD